MVGPLLNIIATWRERRALLRYLEEQQRFDARHREMSERFERVFGEALQAPREEIARGRRRHARVRPAQARLQASVHEALRGAIGARKDAR
jgi:hypothetical protein